MLYALYGFHVGVMEENIMQPHQPPVSAFNLMTPPCGKCGSGWTQLSRIEPSGEPGYDIRTFECLSCGRQNAVKVKFG